MADRLTRADLRGATTTAETHFGGARLVGAIMPDGTIEPG